MSAAMHSGFVRADGQPVPGALVTAACGTEKLSTTTDEGGLYMLDNLRPCKWTIEVEIFGFKTARKEFDITTLPTSATWEMEMAARPRAAISAEQPTVPTTPVASKTRKGKDAPAAPATGPGFQSLTLRKLAADNAKAVVTQPAEAPSPSSATEAFLINGSLTRGLDAPQEEPQAPTPAELERWAGVITTAFWGGSAYDKNIPDEPVVAKKPVAPPKPSMAAAMAPKKVAPPKPGKFGARTGGGPVAANFGNKRKKTVFQGSAYYMMRHAEGDARPYSLSGLDLKQPSYAWSRFGISAGGPLRIPRVYQRQGTYVYFSYAGARMRNPVSLLSTLPSEMERNGDFSRSTQRTAVTIYDLKGNTPYANNVIPVSRMSNASLQLLTLMPRPNLPGTVLNYQVLTSTKYDTDAYSARVNQTLSRRDRVTWTLSLQTRDWQARQLYDFRDTYGGKGVNTELSWSHTFGPKAVNSFKYSLNRNRTQATPYFAYTRNWAAELGINGTSQTPINWGPPNVSFTNFGSLYDAGPSLRRDQSSGVEDSLTWVRGKHNWTFGGDLKRNQINSRTDPNARGSYSFSGLLTSGFDSKNYPFADTGYDFADFLLGYPQSSSIRFGSESTYFRETNVGAFVQDDWRITTKLTINLGLRYEYFTPYREIFGRMANLDIKQWFTGVSVVTPGGTGSYTGPFTDYLVDPDKNNWAPRFGLAWKTPGKKPMTVRAGYGWYYNGSIYGNFATRLAQQPPFASTGSQGTTITRPLTIENGIALAPSTTITNTYAINRYYRVGYAQTWNLALQRDFPKGLMVELGYLGTKGTKLDMQRLPNRANPGSPLTAEQRRIITNAVGFTFESSEGTSIYNAAQVRVVRRFHKGMSGNLLYTFSKSIDNASTFGGGATTVAQFDTNLALERGVSSFDQRHLLQAYYYLASPFGEAGAAYIRATGWKAKLLKDWSLSGGLTLRSGTPFTARVLGNRVDSGGAGVYGSGRAEATGASIDGGRYFNLDAFGLPQVGHFGNAGRNTVPGDTFASLNLSFGRSFRIRETKRWIDVRLDATNLTNTVTFTSFATVVNSKNYGLPVAAAAMRNLNGTLRIRF